MFDINYFLDFGSSIFKEIQVIICDRKDEQITSILYTF